MIFLNLSLKYQLQVAGKGFDRLRIDPLLSTLFSTKNILLIFRMGFLRKVYGLLSVQLLMTSLIGGVCLFNPVVKGLIHSNPWLILVAFVLSMVLLVALHIKRKETPINLILLASFVSWFSRMWCWLMWLKLATLIL